MDAALLERLAVGVDVLAGGEPHHLRAQELAVSVERQAPLGIGLAPRDDLRLEGLAELHLLRQHHGLDRDLLVESERRGDVIDVGAGVLRRLRHRDSIALVLAAVGQEHEPVGLAGGGGRHGELQRLGDIGRAAAHRRLGAVELGRGVQRLVHHRLLAEDDESGLIPRPHGGHGLRREAIGVLARGEADAVRGVQQEHHVQPVHQARDGRLQQGDQEDGHERAAKPEGPAVTEPARQRHPSSRLPAPVEEPLQRERQQRQDHEVGPQLTLDRHRRGFRLRDPGERGNRARRQVRFLGVHEVDRHPRLATRGHHGVDAHLVGVGEARHPAVHRRLHPAARGRDHGRRRDPVLHRQQDRLPGL